VHREFGLLNSKIKVTWENRTKIISVFEKDGSRKMLFRKPQRGEVGELLLTYL